MDASSRTPVVLSIAGSDPLCGAGVMADRATFGAFGWAGCAVETAWVVQNSQGVERFAPVDPAMFRDRLDAVFNDCDVRAIKVGMMADGALIDVLAQVLQTLAVVPPMVVDPVGAAGGSVARRLYRGLMREAFEPLFAHVTLLTPNQRELRALTGVDARTHAEAADAAAALHARGVGAVLLKGGHLEPLGQDSISLKNQGVELIYEGEPWSVDIHGTGCHLSSAIACGLASGAGVVDAARAASRWLHTLVARGAYHRLGHGRPQFDARRLHEGFGV